VVQSSEVSGRLLLDNSVYYSAKTILHDGSTDGRGIFNLASFLEALVLAEEVYVAPTTDWSPDFSDAPLFGPQGPCRQFSLSSYEDDELGALFKSAISECIDDLADDRMPGVLPRIDADMSLTQRALLDWHNQVAKDPRGFIKTYSGRVPLGDPGANAVINSIPSEERMTPELSLANFLLRSNVALLLPAVYQPHSNRIHFVAEKIERIRRKHTLAITLLRQAEETVSTEIGEVLKHAGRRDTFTSQIPLILAVALSGATNRADLVPRALELRSSRVARRYRKWVGAKVQALIGTDLAASRQANFELEDARRVLIDELTKLYGRRPLSSLAKVAQAIRPEYFKAPVGAARDAAMNLDKGWRYWNASRRVAIFVNIARDGALANLNGQIKKVFGRELSNDDIADLNRMRNNLATITAPI